MNDAMSQQEIDLGNHFNPHEKHRVAQRQRAKSLCQQLNQIPPQQFRERQAIARQLFGQVNGCYIEPSFYCDYGCNIFLGKRFYANHNCTILDAASVYIGDNVLLGPGVQLLTNNHPTDPNLRRQGWQQASPIRLGNDVWIGGGAIILGGVTLGDGVIVGAGSVVTRSVESMQMVAGNPARVIKSIDTSD